MYGGCPWSSWTIPEDIAVVKCYPNFITCLYFPLALIRWNSTHCYLIYLMEIFKGKDFFKEKVDLSNFWKTAWSRIILEWYLFLRLSLIRIFKKNVPFCGKTSMFLPKTYLFIFSIFYINKEELNQQVCLIKHVENEIFNYTSQKKGREKQTSFLKLLKICH